MHNRTINYNKTTNGNYETEHSFTDEGSTSTGITLCLVGSAFAAALGSSLQYGFNISVMTGLSSFIQEFYNESHHSKTNEYLTDGHLRWLWATTIAVYCVGGSCGSLIAIYSTNIFGRRGALLLNCVISSLAALCMFISKYINSYAILIIGRWIMGIAVGVVIVAVPLYLSEISPVRYRGGIAAFHQLGVAFGILFGQCIGIYAFYSEVTWPFALLLNLFISWTGASVLYFCPESPRWLLLNQSKFRRNQSGESQHLVDSDLHKAASRKALLKLRGCRANVEAEINEMLRERAKLEASSDSNIGVFDLIKLKNPIWKWPLIISIVLITNQQLCGINAIMYYTTEVFIEAGLDENTVRLATIGTGLIPSTMAIITILNVDKLGRRFFLLAAYSVMAFATVFLSISLNSSDKAWSYLSIFFVYLFIFGFSPGPGAMTFVVIPELWTQGPRPAAMALAGQFNWWSNFTVGLAFPFMLNGLGGYSFLIFTVVLVATVLFTYFIVPETKNKTFTEIVTSFQNNKFTSSRDDFKELDNIAT